MFPLYDENPTRRTAVVAIALIAINIAVFLHEVRLLAQQALFWQFLQTWAAVPRQFFANPLRESFTLVSSQFLHGDIVHLGSNLWFLWLFGNNLEDRLGRARFLAFYLACGVAAAFVQAVFSPGSTVPLIGASGAIAGVMGGYIVCFPDAKIVTLVWFFLFATLVRIPAAAYLGLWILGQTVSAAMTPAGAPGVAFIAHVAGFLAGVALTCLFLQQNEDCG